MKSNSPFRLYPVASIHGAAILGAALAVMLAVASVSARGQQPRFGPGWQRSRQQAGEAGRAVPYGVERLAQNRVARPGLRQWMEQRRNLSPAEQRRELQNDPAFRRLPPEEQQRELDELTRLQGMNPRQLDRRDALLRMTPEQRQQFTSSVQQYQALPPDRRLLVARAFGALRRVPLAERQQAMSTFPLLRQFSPNERQVLGNLLNWEPFFAAQGPE